VVCVANCPVNRTARKKLPQNYYRICRLQSNTFYLLARTEDTILDIINKAKMGNQIAFSSLLDTFWNDVYGFQLKRISKNIHVDLIRKRKRNVLEAGVNNEAITKVLDDAPTVEDKLIIEQNLATLLENIKKLKPINNVKVKLLRAKKLLAEIIKNKK